MRIGAWFIDAIIGGAFVLIAVLATFTNTEFDSSITAELQCDLINELSDDVCIQSGSTVYLGTGSDLAVAFFVWVGAAILLTMIIPAFTGWSPGKRLLGLRVVDQETFELAGVGPNLLRGLLWIVDGFGYITGPLVGGIAMASSDGSRRVGDMAAKTLVVRAEHVGRPVAVANVNSLGGPKQAPVYVAGAPRLSGPTYTPPGAAPPVPAVTPPAASPPPPSGPPASPITPPPATPPAAGAPPVFPPPDATEPPPPSGPLAEHQPPTPVDEPSIDPEPAASEPDPEPAPPEPEAETAEPPAPAARPGVDAPMWDAARDTYIQWDPELDEWMMWSEAGGRWVPISR